jgi:adenine-specific DNA-methyltransferase
MEKLDPKTDGASPNIVDQNIEKLRELFPEAFTEGSDEHGPRWKVDFTVLRDILGGYVEDQAERYSFTWNGKALARRIAQTPSTGTLRPCPEESVNWDTTQNLFIEGDNLEVLKLLQKSYHKKVKMIYIDPPYNTGKDFVYPDDFRDNIKNYLELTGQTDEWGRRLAVNAETSGRYHTDWLNMMYPRLKLARNILRDDGVIFVSIDDREVANLNKIFNEVFGEENFAADFMIKSNPRGSQSTIYSATVHEHLLCYTKDATKQAGFTIPLDESMKSEYNHQDDKGVYRLLGLRLRGGAWRREERPFLYYPIYVNPGSAEISLEPNSRYSHKVLPIKPSTHEEGTWRWSKDKLMHDKDLVVAKQVVRDNETIWDIYQKDYLHSTDGEQKGTKAKTIWDEKEVNYQNGTNEVKHLFKGKTVFDFPKPTFLLKKQLRMISDRKAVILDFFAGSATTAHAVLELNKEDCGNRKFIMVQLPEPCDEKSEAFRTGYKTIADIGKERIRRVIKKLETERAEKAKEAQGSLLKDAEDTPNLDLGFKVFKLDASNIKPWDADFDNLETALFDAVENIKPDRTEEDVLYELLLKYGLDLAEPIEEREIDGRKAYIIGAGALIVCLAKNITLDVVEGIAALKEELKPEIMRVVFKDSGFADDVVKTNAVQILRRAGVEDVKSL